MARRLHPDSRRTGIAMTGILHIVVARKPIEGTIAENCLKHGTGALNLDGCRIPTTEETGRDNSRSKVPKFDTSRGWNKNSLVGLDATGKIQGRWPANLILDEVASELLPECKQATSRTPSDKQGVTSFVGGNNLKIYKDDGDSASRFFFNFAEQESTECD